MTWVIVLVIGAIVVGCILGASDCSRREKLFLDRFPLPSDDEVKEYEKMIPLEVREKVPVKTITEEDLIAYKEEGKSVLEKIGRCGLLKLVKPFFDEKGISRNEWDYLQNLISRHNWTLLRLMKTSSGGEKDISIPETSDTEFTNLFERFLDEDETILTTQAPVQIFSTVGVLILTSKKILFDTAGYPSERKQGIYFLADYSHITAADCSSIADGAIFTTSYEIVIKDGNNSYKIITDHVLGNINEIKGCIEDRMGNSDYSVGHDFDDVGMSDWK